MGSAVIGGGEANDVQSDHCTIAGARSNTIATNARVASILGGDYNVIGPSEHSTISGGCSNFIWHSGEAVIGGGHGNTNSGSSVFGTGGGGIYTSAESVRLKQELLSLSFLALSFLSAQATGAITA